MRATLTTAFDMCLGYIKGTLDGVQRSSIVILLPLLKKNAILRPFGNECARGETKQFVVARLKETSVGW